MKFYQIFYRDEKRNGAISFTRTISSLLIFICLVIIIKAVYIWDIPQSMTYLLTSIFGFVSLLMGIKRTTESWTDKIPELPNATTDQV